MCGNVMYCILLKILTEIDFNCQKEKRKKTAQKFIMHFGRITWNDKDEWAYAYWLKNHNFNKLNNLQIIKWNLIHDHYQ